MKVEVRIQGFTSEFHDYDGFEEAVAGAERLARASFDQYAKDGIEQAIIIHIDAYSDDEDWKPTV